MRRAINITPKQQRFLTGLFIFLPLVPIALFGWLSAKANRVVEMEVPEATLERHDGYLKRLVAEMPATVSGGEEVLDYFRAAFPEAASISIIDRQGNIVAGLERPPVNSSEVLRASLPSTSNRWSVRVWDLPGTLGHEDGEIGANMREHTRNSWIVLVLLVVAAAVAGIVVFRGLKLEALKNDTLTAISHELKTPVASMRLLLETLQERGVDDKEQVSEYVDLMLQENERVSHMVEDFLNHTRLEEKQKRFKMERLGADEIADEALQRFGAKVEELGGRLRCYGRRSGLPQVHGDRQTLVMVLGILIDNAISYSEGPPDIEVDFFTDKRRVYFLVKDRGIGVSKIHRRRIFDKFYQANPTLSRRGGGCGLGLSIARHVVAAHGGEIEHEPRRGQGSVFRFDVPVSGLSGELSTASKEPQPAPS